MLVLGQIEPVIAPLNPATNSRFTFGTQSSPTEWVSPWVTLHSNTPSGDLDTDNRTAAAEVEHEDRCSAPYFYKP